MASRRGSGGRGCLVLVGLYAAFLILPDLSRKYGAWVWFAAIIGPVVVYRLYIKRERRVRERKERERVAAPCAHGTAGAKADPLRCPRCQREIREQQEREERRRIEENERRLAERQRQFDAWKAEARTPEYLRTVDPRGFEKLVCTLFEAMGYEVDETPYSGDGGIDAFARHGGRLALIQCKRVQGSVGEPILRDLWGNIVHHHADEGIVVTTGSVSRQARDWASGKPIRIIELDELTSLVRTYLDEHAVVPNSFQVTSVPSEASHICPRCGRNLRKVKGRRGKFLGCSGYPQCRYTRDLRRGRSH